MRPGGCIPTAQRAVRLSRAFNAEHRFGHRHRRTVLTQAQTIGLSSDKNTVNTHHTHEPQRPPMTHSGEFNTT